MLSEPQRLAEEAANSKVAKGSTGMNMTETQKEDCELGVQFRTCVLMDSKQGCEVACAQSLCKWQACSSADPQEPVGLRCPPVWGAKHGPMRGLTFAASFATTHALTHMPGAWRALAEGYCLILSKLDCSDLLSTLLPQSSMSDPLWKNVVTATMVGRRDSQFASGQGQHRHGYDRD